MNLDTCSRGELVAALLEARSELHRERAINEQLTQQLRDERGAKYNSQRNVLRARKQLADQHNLTLKDEAALVHRGRQGRYYTPYGGLRMAAKRSASNAAAKYFGVATETDVSHVTVTKWEITLRASMVAASRKWHAEQRGAIADAAVEILQAGEALARPVVTYSLNVMRGDASRVPRYGKVHIQEVGAGCVVEPVDDSQTWESVYERLSYRKDMGDLQRCSSSTVSATHAITLKQYKSIAQHIWTDRVVDLRPRMFALSGATEAVAALDSLAKPSPAAPAALPCPPSSTSSSHGPLPLPSLVPAIHAAVVPSSSTSSDSIMATLVSAA